MPQDLLYIFIFCACESTLPLLNSGATAYFLTLNEQALMSAKGYPKNPCPARFLPFVKKGKK